MEIEFEIVFGEKYWNDLLRTQCIYVRLKNLISLITTLFVLSIINHRQSITHLSSWDYQLSNIHQISNPSNIARDHFRNHVTLHSTIPSKIIFFKPLFIQRAEHMSILARDKVPPKTVKANINIPHCRGIPTKLPNQSHSRVVSKRLCKQKGEERRREGGREKSKRKRKEDGRRERREKKGGENVRRLSNDRQLLPPFRAKVQRSEVKARRKNCHEWANRPRASSAHVYFTVYSPRVYETNPRVSARGEEWKPMNDIMHCGCFVRISSRYRHLLKTGHRS